MTYELWDSCLLVPGITMTACAAWVQAWGSIGAILVAVYVSHRADREARRHAISSARTFGGLITGGMEGLLEALRQNDKRALRLTRASLALALQRGATVRMELLPLRSIGAVAALESLAVQALETYDLYESPSRLVLLEDAIERIEDYVHRAGDHCATLSQRHIGD